MFPLLIAFELVLGAPMQNQDKTSLDRINALFEKNMIIDGLELFDFFMNNQVK